MALHVTCGVMHVTPSKLCARMRIHNSTALPTSSEQQRLGSAHHAHVQHDLLG